jgi:hypothetical protein
MENDSHSPASLATDCCVCARHDTERARGKSSRQGRVYPEMCELTVTAGDGRGLAKGQSTALPLPRGTSQGTGMIAR